MRTKVPHLISRVSFLLGLTTALTGVFIGFHSGNDLGWALLRGASLFLAFGIMSRWWLGNMAQAWRESRLQALQTKTTKTTDVRPALGR